VTLADKRLQLWDATTGVQIASYESDTLPTFTDGAQLRDEAFGYKAKRSPHSMKGSCSKLLNPCPSNAPLGQADATRPGLPRRISAASEDAQGTLDRRDGAGKLLGTSRVVTGGCRRCALQQRRPPRRSTRSTGAVPRPQRGNGRMRRAVPQGYTPSEPEPAYCAERHRVLWWPPDLT